MNPSGRIMTTFSQLDPLDEDGVTEKMTCRQSVNAIRTKAMMMVKMMMMMLFEEDVCVWWMTQLGQGGPGGSSAVRARSPQARP